MKMKTITKTESEINIGDCESVGTTGTFLGRDAGRMKEEFTAVEELEYNFGKGFVEYYEVEE